MSKVNPALMTAAAARPQPVELPATLVGQLLGKSLESSSHSKRVKHLCLRFAMRLALTCAEIEELLPAALLHDIGKFFIPAAIIHKPHPLDEDERALMEAHSAFGSALAQRHGFSSEVMAAILHHHERWDGSGYPQRLSSTGIPLFSRIIALTDAYDTIVSRRMYDPPRAVYVAIHEIERQAGRQFDPELADAFLRYLFNQHKGVIGRLSL